MIIVPTNNNSEIINIKYPAISSIDMLIKNQIIHKYMQKLFSHNRVTVNTLMKIKTKQNHIPSNCASLTKTYTKRIITFKNMFLMFKNTIALILFCFKTKMDDEYCCFILKCLKYVRLTPRTERN